MGSRCNFVFSTEPAENKSLREVLAEKPVVLYSHWGGSEAGASLSRALKAAKPRWSDEPYGTRIMVSQIVGNGWDSETGFGLSAGELCDNSYPVLVVDYPAQMVRRYAGSMEQTADKSWLFSEFVALGDGATDAVLQDEDT